jgi:bacterioferritin-associated ferredoxin
MIICSCQRITDRDIHAAVDWMRSADPASMITPGRIYRALGKSPDCGGCMKLFVSTLRNNRNYGVPEELLGLEPVKDRRDDDEGRC